MPLTDEVLSRHPDVVFLEIGCNEIDRVAPFVLAEQVFQFAKNAGSTWRATSYSFAIFFRDSARLRYHVVSDFNDHVTQYNQRMRELTMASTGVDFWRHRGGMWAIWRKLLCDGIHYTNDGQRRYYSNVSYAKTRWAWTVARKTIIATDTPEKIFWKPLNRSRNARRRRQTPKANAS